MEGVDLGKCSWLRHGGRVNSAPIKARLLCFAHAGAGASSFNGWPKHLPDWLELVRVQLPTREDRADDAPVTSARAAIEGMLGEVEALGDLPLGIYGHCLGSLLAFELCRALRRRKSINPIGIFVSGRRPPHAGTGKVLHNLAIDELLFELDAMGASSPMLKHPRWRQHFIDGLRADLTITDTYVFEPEPVLSVPISVFAGEKDPRREEDGWDELTAAEFSSFVLDGGHFFSPAGLSEMIKIIRQKIEASIEALEPFQNFGGLERQT